MGEERSGRVEGGRGQRATQSTTKGVGAELGRRTVTGTSAGATYGVLVYVLWVLNRTAERSRETFGSGMCTAPLRPSLVEGVV